MIKNWYYHIKMHLISVSIFIATSLCTVEIYQEMFQSNSFNGNDLMVLFNWGRSCLINKLSLIRNLNLLVSEVRLSKSSKFIEQLHSSKWSDTADCLILLTLICLGGGVKLTPVCGFSKNVSSTDRVKPWFFVTFNIIPKHIFPENFIEFSQVVKKIWRN